MIFISFCWAVAGAYWAGRFVAIYRKPPFDWKTYEAGRHLMRFTTGILIILVWSALALPLRMVFHEAVWLQDIIDFVRILIFGYVALMMRARLSILLRSRELDLPNQRSETHP